MSLATHRLSYCSLLSSGSTRACASTPNGTAALQESEVQCCHGESWAGRCPVVSEHGHCPSTGRCGVWSFPQEVKAALLKSADRGSRQNVHSSLPRGPAWAVCTFMSALPFPVPYLGCPAAQPEVGIRVPPHPCPCWLLRPPKFFGESGNWMWCSW